MCLPPSQQLRFLQGFEDLGLTPLLTFFQAMKTICWILVFSCVCGALERALRLDLYSQRAGLDCESRLSSKLSQIHTQSQQTAVGQRIIISYSTHWPHFTGNEKDSQRDQVVCAAPFMCSAPDFIHKFKILSQLFFSLLHIIFSVYLCQLCVAFWSLVCEMLTWNHICV